jgi:hypothetical protein
MEKLRKNSMEPACVQTDSSNREVQLPENIRRGVVRGVVRTAVCRQLMASMAHRRDIFQGLGHTPWLHYFGRATSIGIGRCTI